MPWECVCATFPGLAASRQAFEGLFETGMMEIHNHRQCTGYETLQSGYAYVNTLSYTTSP